MDMSTYNADTFIAWLVSYDELVNNAVPRSSAGVGMGCWVDSSTNGTWAVTNASAVERTQQCTSDSVSEIAMFRLVPITGGTPPSWPESFWWPALDAYVQH